MATQQTDFSQGSVKRRILAQALPLTLAQAVQLLYNIVDRIFIGRLPGEGDLALTGLGITFPVIVIIAAFTSLFGTGGMTLFSIARGKRDENEAEGILGNVFALLAISAAVLFVFCYALRRPILFAFGASEQSFSYADQYLKIYLFGTAFSMFSTGLNGYINAQGFPRIGMLTTVIGALTNVVLDPIFIFTLDLGVAGASIATAISKIVSFSILLFPYVTKRSMLHLSIRNFHPTASILTQIVTVGSSSMFRSLLAVVAGIMLNDLAGNISDSVLAGIGVTTKIMMFPFSIILGFGSGFQPVAGFNWGAKRYDRVRESYRFSSIVALVGASAMALFVAIFANPIITAFAGTDPQMQEIGALCIRLQCLALPIHAWVAVVNMFCVGLGNARGAFLLATARQGSCFIPILYPLAFLFDAYGVAASQALADVLTLILAVPIIIKMLKKVSEAEKALAAENQ